MSAIPAAARSFLMGCIIDWTGVLKAPQICRGGRRKDLVISGRKVALWASMIRGVTGGKAFEVTQAQPCLVPVPFRQTSTPHATSRKRPGFQRPGCCSSSRGVRFARSRRSCRSRRTRTSRGSSRTTKRCARFARSSRDRRSASPARSDSDASSSRKACARSARRPCR